MATLKTEAPSTPDAIEDKTETQHHVPSPEQYGQTIQQKRRDGTSIGSRKVEQLVLPADERHASLKIGTTTV